MEQHSTKNQYRSKKECNWIPKYQCQTGWTTFNRLGSPLYCGSFYWGSTTQCNLLLTWSLHHHPLWWPIWQPPSVVTQSSEYVIKQHMDHISHILPLPRGRNCGLIYEQVQHRFSDRRHGNYQWCWFCYSHLFMKLLDLHLDEKQVWYLSRTKEILHMPLNALT